MGVFELSTLSPNLPENGEIGIEEFFNQCKRHDWYFSFSDDHRVYSAGYANEGRLLKLTQQNLQLKEIYCAFARWIDSYYTGKRDVAEPKLTDFINDERMANA